MAQNGELHSSEFQGKWALVTGASAGIGAALARELASRGAKLVLTARRRERLEALASELTARGTEVRIVTADLMDPKVAETIFAATEGAGIAVDILINNAGLGQYGYMHAANVDQELGQIRVNCEAAVALARAFVPQMVERRRGWVLMLASTASFQPVPFLTTYAATKVFDRYFALGLAEEVAPFGVRVTALCPGPTESEFFEIAGAAKFRTPNIQTAEEVARIGLNALERGKRTILPSFSGKAMAFAVRFLPIALITWGVALAARPKEPRTP